jgi:two-component system NtrC family response regulator
MSIAPTVQERPRLLIVDDDRAILSQLSLALGDEYDVFTADRVGEAWRMIRTIRPELVTLDLAIEANNPESGFRLLEQCLEADPFAKVVLITGNDSREHALRAVAHGAYDFFGKPIELDELRVLLRRALNYTRLERQNARDEVRPDDRRLGSLLGHSPPMQAVFRTIRKVAPTDLSVLVLGESGTGKELVAKELRRLSAKSSKPFVSINCAAIPETLLESELFGHERGAFTNAYATRPGKLEMADGGIVLLDEIGELPLALQVKLLRFLQEHEIERVGGRKVLRLDVRVLAATNRDLQLEVSKGRFREDLYYRLSVVSITLPPLRERREDILYLADFFLDRSTAELRRGNVCFSRRAKQAMLQYGWPGNVRELEHHVQRAVVLSRGRLIRAADLGLAAEPNQASLNLRQIRQAVEREAVITALERTSGNISLAASELGISRPTLHDLIQRHEIKASRYRNADGFGSKENMD